MDRRKETETPCGTMEITSATVDDLPEVAEIERSVEGGRAATVEDLRLRLEMFPEGFLVARVGGRVVGYVESCAWSRERKDYITFEGIRDFPAHHDPGGRFFYVIYLCVAESFRRKKVATCLMERLAGVARERGAEEVHLVSKGEVEELYLKLGYEDEGPLEGFLPGTLCIFMRKRLGPDD